MLIIFKHYRKKYGDWDFVKVDTSEEKLLAVGNSGSTDADLRADLDVYVLDRKELDKIHERFI